MRHKTTTSLSQRLHQSRAFLFSLMAISAVWLVSSMSEQKTFREHYRLYIDGIDNQKYATLAADSSIALDITSNGFYAFRRGISKQNFLHINIADKLPDSQNDFSLSLDVNDYIDIIRKQIDTRGVDNFKPVNSSFNISLSKRQAKAFVPNIDNVIFQFDEMSGLCGQPEIKPDTVFLYGSPAVLDQIDAVCAAPQTIPNIKISGRHRIDLQPIWDNYPDLHISTKSIDIYLPVESFTEKTITVPLSFSQPNNAKRIQLYPASVNLQCLVPKRLYSSISDQDFQVFVQIPDDSSSLLKPVVSRFPANVRIKNISPQNIQYIIFK